MGCLAEAPLVPAAVDQHAGNVNQQKRGLARSYGQRDQEKSPRGDRPKKQGKSRASESSTIEIAALSQRPKRLDTPAD